MTEIIENPCKHHLAVSPDKFTIVVQLQCQFCEEIAASSPSLSKNSQAYVWRLCGGGPLAASGGYVCMYVCLSVCLYVGM